jgi:predicted glutamine amidotransferase
MIVGAGSISVDYLVDGLQTMAQKSHVDGWGGAHLNDDRLVMHKSSQSCLSDMLLEAYTSVSTNLLALHARRSPSKGVVSSDNAHPFWLHPDYYVFHNTQFNDGSYDPKRLVLHIKNFFKPGEEEVSLARALLELKDFTAANCMLVGPKKAVVAVRYDKNSRKAQYYQMAFSAESNDVLVSSETLMGRKWRPLPDGSLITLYPNGRYDLIPDMRSLT